MKEKCIDLNKFKVIDGSILKIIAVITMFIDHFSSHILSNLPVGHQIAISILGKEITWCYLLHAIGRTAFPIFAFLITEGYIHTRNRFKYGRNLLIFALISELPWNYVHSLSLRYPPQNVYFTLFFGYLGICFYEKYKDCMVKQIASLGAVLLVCTYFGADYGLRGFVVILVLYYLRNSNILRSVVGIGIINSSIKTIPAFVLIGLYNGKRGFIKSNFAKYCFYAFYPVHLIVLAYFKKKYFG